MNNAAQRLVEDFFVSFKSPQEEPEFALVRIFRIMNYAELTPELQAITESESGQYLTLMGTIGLEKRYDNKWRRGISFTAENVNVSDLGTGARAGDPD